MRPCVFSGEFIAMEIETSDRSCCRVRVFLDHWNYGLLMRDEDKMSLTLTGKNRPLTCV